jgi:hypothetical protein
MPPKIPKIECEKLRKSASPVLVLKPLQMASTPYKSLIYGQKSPENRRIPGNEAVEKVFRRGLRHYI